MEKVFSAVGGWSEVAGANVVQERSDLIKIYSAVKAKCQTNIDNAFDKVSREVGYVVTTTIPVNLELEKGKVKRISMGAENLKGTHFEKAMIEALKPLVDDPIPVSGNAYTVILLWHPAFMLTRTIVDPQVCEYAHLLKDIFMHLGERVATVKEQLQASAIDQVYPELNFAPRLANSKATSNTIQSNATLSNLQNQKRII